jgi:hypothetical protein
MLRWILFDADPSQIHIRKTNECLEYSRRYSFQSVPWIGVKRVSKRASSGPWYSHMICPRGLGQVATHDSTSTCFVSFPRRSCPTEQPRAMSNDTQRADQIAFHFYTKLFYVVNHARATANPTTATKPDKWVRHLYVSASSRSVDLLSSLTLKPQTRTYSLKKPRTAIDPFRH